jgi:hypothetical protein
LMPDINLSPLTAEQAALDRRRKLAEAMQQQSVLPIDMPTVPGAKVSHAQGLAKLLQGYIAGKNLERAETQQKELEANTMADFAKIFGLSGQTETIPGKEITPATVSVPAEMSPAQQVPALKADMLNDPNFTKTSAGRMMLAQALMQQRAQEQAAALRRQEAGLAIQSVAPGAALVQGGKVIYTNPKEVLPKWEKSSQFDADGKEIMGWVNTNAPNIPASFVKGTEKPAMTEAQRLDAELKLYGTKVEADKAQDVGRKPIVFERLPKGVPVGAKKIGKSPDGKDVYESNGKKYVGE